MLYYFSKITMFRSSLPRYDKVFQWKYVVDRRVLCGFGGQRGISCQRHTQEYSLGDGGVIQKKNVLWLSL